MKRILVTGSRTWANPTTIQRALRQAWMDLGAEPDTVLVSGACPDGADALAEHLWSASGMDVERHPAQWLRFGRSAGFKRNEHMVHLGADMCLAFHKGGSKGTGHTISLAQAAGIETRIFKED